MDKDLPRWQPRDPITAARLNAMSEGVNGLRRDLVPSARRSADAPISDGVDIDFRNDTGGNLELWSVVGIGTDEPFIAVRRLSDSGGFTEQFCVKGVDIDVATHKGRFGVVVRRSVADGGFGKIRVVGACPVRLTVASTADRYADLTNASGTLTTGASGVPLLYASPGTGAQVGVVLLGHRPADMFPVLVKQTGGSAGPPCTFTYSVYANRDVPIGGVFYPIYDPIGTDIEVVNPRHPFEMTPGLYGLAFYDAAGDLKLFDAGERIVAETCTDDSSGSGSGSVE